MHLHVKINTFMIIVVNTVTGIEVSPSPSSSLYESSPSLSLQFSPPLTPLLSQSPSPTLKINGEFSSTSKRYNYMKLQSHYLLYIYLTVYL